MPELLLAVSVIDLNTAWRQHLQSIWLSLVMSGLFNVGSDLINHFNGGILVSFYKARYSLSEGMDTLINIRKKLLKN